VILELMATTALMELKESKAKKGDFSFKLEIIQFTKIRKLIIKLILTELWEKRVLVVQREKLVQKELLAAR
jgi:hypothetical protein